MRLRSDFWVGAYVRTCEVNGAYATVRRRGDAAAGAILVRIDRRDGTGALYGPAPQTHVEASGADRAFVRMHGTDVLDDSAIEARLAREVSFDSDVWIIEVEDRAGRHFLDQDPA